MCHTVTAGEGRGPAGRKEGQARISNTQTENKRTATPRSFSKPHISNCTSKTGSHQVKTELMNPTVAGDVYLHLTVILRTVSGETPRFGRL